MISCYKAFQTYMQMLPFGEVPIVYLKENPKREELWEILAEIKNNQMWVKIDDNLCTHHEALNPVIG